MLIYASITGVGLAMLWQRAEPLKPAREWIIIRLNRLHDQTRSYPIWWLKGALGCETCLSPWMAWMVAGIWLQSWEALAAGPIAYVLVHLMPRSAT